MKNNIVKKSSRLIAKESQPKSHRWIWVMVAFLLGVCVGYGSYYLTVNWKSFFVVCPDGNKPDNNGCCDGEVYTDAGDGWMVCCPKDGDNCFPPMK